MTTYILRNNTIESVFGSGDTEYSGYDDVSVIPQNKDLYVWFYQVPFKFDQAILTVEVASYKQKFLFAVNNIPGSKNIITFTLFDLFGLQFIDGDFGLKQAIRDFNDFIIAQGKEKNNIKIIDTAEFFNQFPQSEWVDWKYYFLSQMSINPKMNLKFRKWYSKKLNAIQLQRKKCLVLDLDNTLWGGVLGEDGINGLQIGGDYPGKAFLYFQQAIKELSKHGVILTVCSKNNEEDVLQAWKENPFMVLKKDDFSAYCINWNNKADNIKELSAELNIGLDSMVFIDDNPTERELIKQMLPMVEVPDFPEKPYLLPQFFKTVVDNYFRIYALTDEDRQKTEQYRQNAVRKSEESKFSSIEDYLKSLNIEITIEKINDFNLQRIAQMTQKTNQFNLTTKRYTDSDIKTMWQKGDLIYCIGVKDKFGDNGITGEIIIKQYNDTAIIDTFLLSCRILGKGIEEVFIKTVLNQLKKDGIKTVNAKYIPTQKNVQVKDFYDRMGFELIKEINGEKEYSLQLSEKELEVKPYYKTEIR